MNPIQTDAACRPSSVASLTVAYNGAHPLRRQLDVLLRQSRALDEIVVVDNASTDGTLEMLASEYPQVTVLRCQRNTGAAGGFARGWQYAIGKGHNWVWSFDQDSVPDERALETLLRGQELMGAAIVVPLPVDPRSGISYPPLWWRDGLVRPDKKTLELDVWFADVAVASGSLVRRDVIAIAGVPREEFFMDFFDFEYCLRARGHGFQIAVIRECKLSHEIGRSKAVRFLGKRRTWPVQEAWREFYVGRNAAYVVCYIYPSVKAKFWLARYVLRHAVAVLLFGEHRAPALIRFLQGTIDGIRGQLGVRFLPGQRV